MLIEFSVENFASYKTMKDASRINRVFWAKKNLGLLKTKAIFGGNASGKSKLIAALSALRKTTS